jgi:hypothetical protein
MAGRESPSRRGRRGKLLVVKAAGRRYLELLASDFPQ